MGAAQSIPDDNAAAAADQLIHSGLLLKNKPDIALRFANILLSVIPALCVLVLGPRRIYKIPANTPVLRPGVLPWIKSALGLVLIGVNIANVVNWLTNPLFQANVSLPAAILACAASLCVTLLLYAEHVYSLQPSTFLTSYLGATLLFDGGNAYFYLTQPGLEGVGAFVASKVTVKLLLLLAETVAKRVWLSPSQVKPPIGRDPPKGFWNRPLFLWINSILAIGYREIITVNTLPPIGTEFDSEYLYNDFLPHWEKADVSSQFALAMTCLKTLSRDFFSVVLPRLGYVAFKFAQPFLLQEVVLAVRKLELSVGVIVALIFSTAVIYCGIAIFRASYTHMCNRVTTSLRGVLTVAIFQKVLRLSHEELQNAAATTLITTDMANLERLVPLFHDMWASCLELGLGIYILATLIGHACFSIVIPAAITATMTTMVAQKMIPARLSWNEKVESRVAKMSNILVQLKSVKMAGLSPILSAYLQRLRDIEVSTSMVERSLRVSLHALHAVTASLTPVIVLAATLFWTRAGEGLATGQIFVILAIVAIVSEPLGVVLVAIPFFSNAFASLSRIQNFLQLEEIADTRIKTQSHQWRYSMSAGARNRTLPGLSLGGQDVPGLIRMADVTVASITAGTLLTGVSLDLPMGSVSMVYGPVGCGKSTLLRTIVGESRIEAGTVTVPDTPMAFCDQTPWLQNGSIRDCIISQTEWVRTRYNKVLHACALDEDILLLAEGDNTMVGTGGGNLSGGQKQRVALARALYMEASVFVLDDVLSAVDANTVSKILDRLFGKGGLLRSTDITVIMTTNFPEHLIMADLVFTFSCDGKVQRVPAGTGSWTSPSEEQKSKAATDSSSEVLVDEKTEPVTSHVPAAKEATETELSAERQRGDFTLYFYYLQPAGFITVIAWLFTAALAATVERMPQIFARIWMQLDPHNKNYFVGYALLGLLNVGLAAGTTAFYYRRIVATTSIALHKRLLDSVMNAKLYFLTDTDAGSILNRFSQDMTLVAQKLPQFFLEAAYLSFSIVVDIGIISAGARYTAAIIPLFMLFLYFISCFYLRTSRQLRHLDTEARTPLYTQLMEATSGIRHIRSFRWGSDFIWQNFGFIDYSQKPYYYLFCIQRWLALVLDLSTCVVAVSVVGLAVIFRGWTTESAVGLAMLNLISFSKNVALYVENWVDVETSLGGISRIRDFCINTPQEKDTVRGPKLQGDWPSNARVEFRRVSATYKPENGTVTKALDGISFKIRHGQKVGVKGRTGSGKSSLLYAMLNLLEYNGIITIDNRDVKTIPRDFLRSRITTITQDIIKLNGSIRTNLDPFDPPDYDSGYSLADETLTDVLSDVGLLERIEAAGGLDTELADASLSEGQMQLLALARAILRKQYSSSRLILIDEATSSLDMETDKRMQEVMAKYFAGSTVIMVSHRDKAFDTMDMVLTMDEGKITEVKKRDRNTGELLVV